jgi:hypothetical protein
MRSIPNKTRTYSPFAEETVDLSCRAASCAAKKLVLVQIGMRKLMSEIVYVVAAGGPKAPKSLPRPHPFVAAPTSIYLAFIWELSTKSYFNEN